MIRGEETSKACSQDVPPKAATSIDLIADQVTCFIGNASTVDQARQLMPNRMAQQAAERVEPLRGKTLMPGIELYTWHGCTIARVYESSPVFAGGISGSWRADIVVISNNAVKDLRKLSGIIVAKCYVIDGSNDRTTTARLNNQAQQLPLRLHSVLREGAFNLRL